VIAAVVLAAGGSSRLGRPKALVEVEGSPLVVRAVDAVKGGGCDPVIVVLGADASRVRAALADRLVSLVIHDRWADGIAASIRAGIASLVPRPEVEAVLLAVSDQPALDARVVTRLLEAWNDRPAGSTLAACSYGGTLGTPAVFSRARFDDLARLSGDRGAAVLLRRDPARVAAIAWPEGAADVDRPGDVPRP
jgi:CTP:molybdopterin cytidylyltransferase MocA